MTTRHGLLWGTALSALITLFAQVGLAAGGEAGLVLDTLPAEHQKPYSPAWEQTVEVTPPPFIWVPVAKPSPYILQISRSPDFDTPDTLSFRDLTTSVFVPGEPLASGKWYWRYGVARTDGDMMGKARPFSVSESARPFPFPDFDEVVRNIPRQHPRLFFPGPHLEKIRRAGREELKDSVDRIVARARQAVGQPIVAEPPRPKTGPDKVQVMISTRAPMDDMERCGLAYLLTSDEALGQEAKRRILHFFSWDPNGSTGLWSYDEPAMWVMMRGIRTYDWTYDLFSPAERAAVEPVMKERARQFYVHLKEKRKFESDPYESHAGRMPGFLGEAALCFAHEWPEAGQWLRYATLIYYTSYPAWGGDDGGWQEGPGYWNAYMSFALHYVVALRQLTGVDLSDKPFFRNTPYFALYTATPYHQYHPFGDGAMGGTKQLGMVLYTFAALLSDPYLAWYPQASQKRIGDDLLTLAAYDPNLKPKNPSELPHGRCFPSVGLAALHTHLGDKDKDVTFLLRSSPYGSVSHGHADQNAFVIEAFGKALALATGYYPWYGSPHHQDWTRDTRAVNSILVDGEGQVKRSWQARGEITAFQTGKGYDYIEGEAGQAYGGRLAGFRRHVVHIRPGIFVIFDRLKANKPATFQWLLHAANEIGIEGQSLTVRNEPAGMRVELLWPTDLTITQTNKYTPEPEVVEARKRAYPNTWHLSAGTVEPAKRGHFLAVLMIHRTDENTALPKVERIDSQGVIGVSFTWLDGTKETVGFRTNPTAERVVCGTLTSSDRVFAEARDKAGQIVRSLSVPVE